MAEVMVNYTIAFKFSTRATLVICTQKYPDKEIYTAKPDISVFKNKPAKCKETPWERPGTEKQKILSS